jgi:histone deacetylase 1/2
MLINEIRLEEKAVNEVNSKVYGDVPLDLLNDPSEVWKAKQKELASIDEYQVKSEVKRTPNMKVIKMRWVLTQKPDRVKARLVCKEFRTTDDTSNFAPTPCLAALRLVLQNACLQRSLFSHSKQCLRVVDISTAFLNAWLPAGSNIYVEPPPDVVGKETVWLLHKALYGLRSAPRAWADHLASILLRLGFSRVDCEPSLYVKGEGSEQVVLLIHVDDVVMTGSATNVTDLTSELEREFAMTVGPLLLRTDDSCTMLGRTIVRTDDGFELRGDDTLITKSVVELGLSTAKHAPTPFSSSSPASSHDDEPLSAEQHASFRVHVGRLLYISADRLDISYSSKTLARSLHSPTVRDWQQMKHVFRYLLGRPVLPLFFNLNKVPRSIDVFTDSDWASCKKTRRSTSGGIVCTNQNILHFWSRTQHTVALSSAEAELGAAVTAAGEGLFLQKLWLALGHPVKVNMHIDSKACIDHLRKLGLGKLKHIQIRSHYLQQLIRDKQIYIFKIAGEQNVSDLLTKSVTSKVLQTLLSSPLINLNVSLFPFLTRKDASVDIVNWTLDNVQEVDTYLRSFLM